MSGAGLGQAGETEQPKGSPFAQYVAEIELYDKEASTWAKRREKITKRYKDERSDSKSSETHYNILWPNIQTLLPALGARNPKPDIQRRFKDADPIGRVASDVLERCVSYFSDTDRFYAAWRQSVFDYALTGRGTVWVRYNPTIIKEAVQLTDDAQAGQGGDNEEPQFTERLAYEDVEVDYVHSGDFGYNVCRTWEEVWLGWRIVYMTRAEMVERFGKKKGKLPPLDYRAKNSKKQTLDDGIGKACIYEVWDKSKKRAVWFHKTVPDYLDEREDPLRLKDFFPFPKPLLANLANDSLIPVPDYILYQDQAVELDNLTGRIQSITKSIKVAGVYAGDAQGVGRLLSEGTENQLIAVEQWAMFAEKGGLKGVMEFLPLEQIANALTALYAARDKVKGDLYEITGMADIVRGNSDARETATAQDIKSSFATMRLSDRQRDVQRFVREIIRIMVDMMCGHFQLDTIKAISGVRLLTAEEKKLYAGYAAPATPPAPAAGPAPIGHNGGPPMGAMGMQPQIPPGQPAPMQGAPIVPPAMVQGALPPHPMMAPPGAPTNLRGPLGIAGNAPGIAGPAMPPPPLPPLPSGVTRDHMQTMLADPSWEEVDALIRNEPLRCFRIDIETDSTIKADEQQDKADRVEFLKAAGGFLQQAQTIGDAQPKLLPLLAQMLMFGIRGFPIGKELEGTFNAAITAMEKEAANPQQKPSPEMAKIAGEMQLQENSAKHKAQLEMQQTQDDAQTAREQAKADAAVEQHKNQLEYQRRMGEMALEERIAKYKIDKEADTQIRLAYINNSGKLAAAQVTAGVGDGSAELARDDAGQAPDPTLIPMQFSADAPQPAAAAQS